MTVSLSEPHTHQFGFDLKDENMSKMIKKSNGKVNPQGSGHFVSLSPEANSS